MGENVSLVDSHSFHRRITTASHAAILMTVFVLSMIYLETVLKPFFIAMGIYFVLKPVQIGFRRTIFQFSYHI